ncbi:VanZ family protein [Inmirania thermothiophila]|uniref:VanZ like protein n=1 Tax=Inmirania thermothiophila TaxID=1750597 RepID=A0A3N1Y1U8_9GAMM|nr:VanZ family protein [Inmirania thermothiophila]ROR32789.1 VanZ like protein [Inmirania thermothiophila]
MGRCAASRERLAAAAACLYLAALYLGTGWLRTVQTGLRDLLGAAYGPALTGLVAAALGAGLWAARGRLAALGARRAPLLAAVGAGYAAALALLAIPEERIHLLQFGLLALLLTAALRRRPRRHLEALILGLAAGAGDEVAQWLHPARVGDLGDVALNFLGSVLAQAALWTLDRPPRPAPPP